MLAGGRSECVLFDKWYIYTAPTLEGGEIQHGIFSGAKFARVEARNTSDEVLTVTHLVGSRDGLWLRAHSANNNTL
ncbi:unnamed protein product [Penicillium camemberti]|uniref:Str. FM013 n=1 Tax=Penicillium camemberti (strain FM 013) TaxID=1429867 RepID=A0A0G4P3U3_PENC3|nr:unnamed protein product [Penicillium camemberti]